VTRLHVAVLAATIFVLCAAAPGWAGSKFDGAVAQMLAEPYQADYVPAGLDTAFPTALNVLPAEDYTSGSIAGSPDYPGWPAPFAPILLHSGDGAPFYAYVALHPGKHAGVVVVHGFNTHGYDSVVRWAAMLYANGYNVIAADQRDFAFEYNDPNEYGYPNWLQTFGWKESEDVLAAGKYLKSRPGVASVGVVGFSEGAQNTVLALAQDSSGVFSAGLTFSAPADQATQVYSTAEPAGCDPATCTYPATSALVTLVVPPYDYTDPCAVLADAAALYKTTPNAILARENAFQAQQQVRAPLLNFYAEDDPLVQAFQAKIMAAYTKGTNMRTLELAQGAHAYYYDRWWQQRAILLYFKALLPNASNDPTITTTPTVNQTPGGTAAATQLVDLGSPTKAEADAMLGPDLC